MAGGAVQLQASVTVATAPARNLILQVSVFDPAGNRVASNRSLPVSLLVGENASATLQFPSTVSQVVGAYRVELVASSDDSAQPLLSVASAATINVLPPIRITSGAKTSYRDSLGLMWSLDAGFTGGVGEDPSTLNYAILNTKDPWLYRAERWGGDANGNPAPFSYRFAVPPNGKYQVRLLLAENYVTAVGQRLFAVSINGKQVLSEFDIFKEAGGMYIPIDKVFFVQASTTGTLDISFLPGSIESPKSGSIEIIGVP